MGFKKVVIFDNAGKSNDCYTAINTKTGDVFGFNAMPQHPTYGFGQYTGNVTDRMNVTYGYGWAKRFDEKKVLKEELRNYLNEAKKNPEWLGREISVDSLSAEAKKYVDYILRAD